MKTEVIELAKTLLKNADKDIWQAQFLQKYIEEPFNENDEFTLVLKCILQDDYATCEFTLVDIYNYGVYCFANRNIPYDPYSPDVKEFHVYVNWGENKETIVGYLSRRDYHKASCIAEAIEKFNWDNEYGQKFT